MREKQVSLWHACLRPVCPRCVGSPRSTWCPLSDAPPERGRAFAVHFSNRMHDHQDSRIRMTPRCRAAQMPTTYPEIPSAADVTKSTIAYLRCGGGQNDWQERRIMATSKYIAFSLPKPVLKAVRDIIYFRDICQCEVEYRKNSPAHEGSIN